MLYENVVHVAVVVHNDVLKKDVIIEKCKRLVFAIKLVDSLAHPFIGLRYTSGPDSLHKFQFYDFLGTIQSQANNVIILGSWFDLLMVTDTHSSTKQPRC